MTDRENAHHDNAQHDEDEHAQQNYVKELLAQQPRPTMPATVAATINTALRVEAEQRPRPSPQAARFGRPRRNWVMPLSVAAAVLLLAGVVVLPNLLNNSQQATTAAGDICGVTAAATADMTPVSSASGAQYSAAEFTTQSAALLSRARPACVDGSEEMADKSESNQFQATQPQDAPSVSLTKEPPSRADVMKCLLAVVPGKTVVAVDHGHYTNVPVVVVIIRQQPMRAYAIDCGAKPVQVVYEADL